MKSIFKIILVVMFFSGILFGINNEAGTRGFSFLKVPSSARAAALGNAYTAEANDANAVFYNPAGLLQLKKKDIQTTYMSYLDGGQIGAISYAGISKSNIHWGTFLQYFYSGDIDRTLATPNGDYLGKDGTFYTTNFVTGMSFAKYIKENLELGATVKYIRESLDEQDASASALALDLSLLHQSPNPKMKLALAIRNLGKQITYHTDEKISETLPLTFIGGFRFQKSKSLIFIGDGYLPLSEDIAIRLGVEKVFNNYFKLRLGYDSKGINMKGESDGLEALSGLTAGFGTKWRRLKIDYALVNYGELGYINQIGLSYLF